MLVNLHVLYATFGQGILPSGNKIELDNWDDWDDWDAR